MEPFLVYNLELEFEYKFHQWHLQTLLWTKHSSSGDKFNYTSIVNRMKVSGNSGQYISHTLIFYIIMELHHIICHSKINRKQHFTYCYDWYCELHMKKCMGFVYLWIQKGSSYAVRTFLSQCFSWHIGAETKWPIFCWWHIQMHVFGWKLLHFDLNFTEVCCWGSDW